MRQSVQDYLNQDLVIGIFLKNGSEATLSSKMNVVSVSIEHFSIFCKFLSGRVETIFWESDAKGSKHFKLKFGKEKLLSKCFLRYLELKNEWSERLNRSFFSFFANFSVTKLKAFSGKIRQSVQNHLNRMLVIGIFS